MAAQGLALTRSAPTCYAYEPFRRRKGSGRRGACRTAISSDYSRDGVEQTIVVTRSNNRATRFNLSIRTLINMSEEELVRGERIMVAKNNYHWTHQIPGVDFIANGDMAVIESIHGLESRYGLRFADVTLTLPDRDAVVDCKIILDALVTDAPHLTAIN